MKVAKTNPVFEEAVSALNTAQRQAVDTIDGPVMVIAGPGTGKTQILTLRIANILLQTDTKPEQVLALTFTDSGVRAMRERLARFIGQDAYHVPIHTFHSFAGDLIKRYPDAYENIVGGRPASELEKISIIEKILESTEYKRLRPHGDPQYYVKPILQAIATLKKEYVSPDVFARAIDVQAAALEEIPQFHEKGAHKGKVRGPYVEAEKSLQKNQELLSIYREYAAALKADRLYDFEDMILDTITALESSSDMLLDVQEQYQYILADEHQDVNQSQNRLIELIASYHERPNVFVVGDEKQAIYRFQGASLDNFLYFGDVYKDALTIALTENYRSDQAILDAAHESIKTDDPTLAPLRVPLKAAKSFETSLTVQQFPHTAVEEGFVVSAIEAEIKKGTSPEEIAVIVRTNREVELFTKLLRKANVPVAPSADTDILDHVITKQALTLLRAVVEPENERLLAELLHAPYLGVSTVDLVRVLAARSYAKSLRSLLVDEDALAELGVTDTGAGSRVLSICSTARDLAVTKSAAEIVEYVFRESGFLDFVIAEEPLQGATVVRRIYDEVEGMCEQKGGLTLKEVLEQFALLQSYGLPLTAPAVAANKSAVAVMTAHKAKGLEFEVVCLPHLTDNVWGGSRARSSTFALPITKHEVADAKDLLEDDERRLFYVSLTRAKRRLLCSHSVMNTEGREFAPSRFLTNLLGEYIEEVDQTQFMEEFSPLTALTPVPKVQIDTTFLRTALLERGWSATSFNNYHESPWEFIYKNVLRIPTIKTPELQFGTAVHAVLERIVRHQTTHGTMPEDTRIVEWLDHALGQNVLSVSEFTRLHERGMKAVFGYQQKLQEALLPGMTTRTEFGVKATLETGLPDFPEVLLTGNFDRIDSGADGVAVRVVDYKTGKPKTRGEIAGTTKTSNGNYKRQLVFYALLLSLQSDERLKTANTVLSFVEPDQKGVIHEEAFSITFDEIAELRQEIIEATRMVVTGECLRVPCDPEVTDFCHLVERLK